MEEQSRQEINCDLPDFESTAPFGQINTTDQESSCLPVGDDHKRSSPTFAGDENDAGSGTPHRPKINPCRLCMQANGSDGIQNLTFDIIACVSAHLRLVRRNGESSHSRVVTVGSEVPGTRTQRRSGWLEIDEDRKTIYVDGKEVNMSRKEYDVVVYLHSRNASVSSRDELIATAWPDVKNKLGVSDAAMDQLIHRLRLKIEPDPHNPIRLLNRKGFGFLLV